MPRPRHVIALSPVVNIPTELEKLFVVLEHELPSREQIAAIAQSTATEENDLPEGPDFERIVMEEKHKRWLIARFPGETRFSTIHVLNIPADYRFMDLELVELVRHAVDPLLENFDRHE